MATRTALLTLALLVAPLAQAEHTPPVRTGLAIEYLAHTVLAQQQSFADGRLVRVGGLSAVRFSEDALTQSGAYDFNHGPHPLKPGGRTQLWLLTDSPERSDIYAATLQLTRSAGAGIACEVRFDARETPDAISPVDAPAMPEYERLYSSLGDIEAALEAAPRAADAEAFDSAHGLTAFAFESPHQIVIRDEAEVRLPPFRSLPLPEGMAPSIRENRGFESLALAAPPDGPPVLWAATESSITTDGEEATTEAGTRCTLLRWDDFDQAPEQLLYITDPMPPHFGPSFALHSLTELEALPDGRLLALERSLTFPAGFGAKLYIVDPQAAGRAHTDGRTIVHKTLLADLSAMAAGNPELTLGNLEGLALGPTIARLTGDPSQEGHLLLLVADDNFGDPLQQRGSLVLALRLLGLEAAQPPEGAAGPGASEDD